MSHLPSGPERRRLGLDARITRRDFVNGVLVGAGAAVLGASDHGKAPGHTDDPQTDVLCPICIASSAIANAIAATPPAIPLQLTATVVDRPIAPVRLAVALPRAPFQSRGPPVS